MVYGFVAYSSLCLLVVAGVFIYSNGLLDLQAIVLSMVACTVMLSTVIGYGIVAQYKLMAYHSGLTELLGLEATISKSEIRNSDPDQQAPKNPK